MADDLQPSTAFHNFNLPHGNDDSDKDGAADTCNNDSMGDILPTQPGNERLIEYEKGFSDNEGCEDAFDRSFPGPRPAKDNKKPRVLSLFGGPISQSDDVGDDADDEAPPKTPGQGMDMRMSSLTLDQQQEEDNGEGPSRPSFNLAATLGLSDNGSPRESPAPSAVSMEDEVLAKDPVVLYRLRKNIDRQVVLVTWVNVDQSGNYNLEEERQKAKAAKAKKRKGKQKAVLNKGHIKCIKRCSLKTKKDQPPCKYCKRNRISCTFYDLPNLEMPKQGGKKKAVQASIASSSALNIAPEVSMPGLDFFDAKDLADLEREDKEELVQEETPEIEMEDAEGRRGILTEIQTSFAYPIKFSTLESSSICSFCEMPSFRFTGHFEKTVHVLRWNNGLRYTELTAGHREDNDATIMCQECVMQRVQTIYCPAHGIKRIAPFPPVDLSTSSRSTQPHNTSSRLSLADRKKSLAKRKNCLEAPSRWNLVLENLVFASIV
ncbi:hypothetical protein BU26DRAFT_563754 [Trematosphaeria pertusa]|uniref:Zn(2)-C6 fungal-type domain-containing protein n=1 Tax=Trematosphaeria pertusa TaxID=390896 RepID=A0A6A6III8_9PLEO|nr:uncharacterized protein BU26DRAFT_563754 [Trematosphaeria pertusa]KAF2249858.1 hypothetical protein BU26DRAFT_563754 [Trematosphaeria pertusa]